MNKRQKALASTNQGITYEKWMDYVDRFTVIKYGISYHDLPDLLMTRDTYDSGCTVETFLDEVHDVIVEEFGALLY